MSKISTILEFIRFLRAHKKYWLLPIIILLGFLGIFIVFAADSSLAPFIYTLF